MPKTINHKFINIKTLKLIVFFGLSLSLFCCVNFNKEKSLKVKLPKEWAEKIETESKPQKLEFGWWKTAKDKKLEEIIDKILAQNLSLKQAYFRLAAAREDSLSQAYLPKLDLNNNLVFNKVVDGKTGNFFLLNNPKKPNSYYKSTLDASWELPLFGQFSAASKGYKADSAFAFADINLIKTSLISEAIRIYSQIRFEQNRLNELAKIIDSQQKILSYTEIRLGAGFANDIELNQAKQQKLLFENESLQSKANLTSYQRQIAKLMGETSFDPSLETLAQVPQFNLPNFSNTPADVIRNRPDIQKAESEVLKALATSIMARSELFPKITLGGSLSLSDNLVNKPTLGRSLNFGATPSISIPLFDFGKRLANDRVKKAQLFEFAERYKEAVVGAINEVETNYSSYGKKVAQELNLLEASNNLEKILIQTSLLNANGLKDGIDLENAAINNGRSKISLLESRIETISQLTLLVKSLGGYYENLQKVELYEQK